MLNSFWNAQFIKFKDNAALVENLYLPAIVESFARIEKVGGIASKIENAIRNELAYDLENNSTILKSYFDNNVLKLTKENTILLSPTDTKRTDIEFFISGYGDFVVECKNLGSAEKRYIDEGINRFVNTYYSAKSGEAAMIGFIVKGTVAKIMLGLKTKIQDETSYQNVGNEIGLPCIHYPHSFHSTHTRRGISSIRIYHLFKSFV